MADKAKTGGGSKLGRKKAKCERYLALGKRYNNKRRRLRRIVRLHPNDRQAAAALARLEGIAASDYRRR